MSYFPRRKELVSGLKIRPSNLLLNLGDEKILPFHSAKEMQVALRWIANYSWHFYILLCGGDRAVRFRILREQKHIGRSI